MKKNGKMYAKRFISVLLAALFILTLVACSGSRGSGDNAPAQNEGQTTGANKTTDTDKTTDTKDAETVTFGVILPMTGGSARMGELQYEGIKLFAEYYNEQGGIKALGGAKIELMLADSTGVPEVGATEAERLINSGKISGLIGPYNSSVGASTVPVAEKYGMPYIVINCTANNVLENDNLKYSFRTNQSNYHNGTAYIGFIQKINEEYPDNQVESIAIVYESTDWGVGVVDTYGTLLEEIGIEIPIKESFETGSPDFSAVVNKCKAAKVDAIMPAMYVSDAQLFTQQMKEYQLDVPLVAAGGGVLVDDFVDTLGDLSEYIVTLNGWSIDALELSQHSELAWSINDKIKASKGCEMNENVANGWLGVAVLVDAIERAGTTDSEAVAKALAETDLDRSHVALAMHPYEGVKFGKVDKMTNQNIYATGIMTQLINGQYKQVYPDFEGNPLVWPIPKWSER